MTWKYGAPDGVGRVVRLPGVVRCRGLLVPLVAQAVLAACGTTEDTASVAACPDGQIDDGGACVPEACGIGPWGNAPIDADTVFVLEGGTGNGSIDAPMGSIAEAVALASTRASKTVAIGAGRYREALDLNETVDGVRVTGRCRELVALDGSELPRRNPRPLLYVNGLDGRRNLTPDVLFANLSLVGAPDIGIFVDDTALTLQRVDVISARTAGVFFAQSSASLDDVRIIDTRIEPDTGVGRGLYVTDGSDVDARSVEILGAAERGIYVSRDGTRLTLADSRILAVGDQHRVTRSAAVTVATGAELDATGLEIDATVGAGMLIDGAGTQLRLRDGSVRGTLTPANADAANAECGLFVQNGANAELENVRVEETVGVGVAVMGEGASVVARDLEVTGSVETRAGIGQGVSVAQSGRFRCTDCRIVDNTEHGIRARGSSTAVTLEDVEVRGTRSTADGYFGRGIGVYTGASLVGTRVVLAENTGVGILASGDNSIVRLSNSDIGWTRFARSEARAEGAVSQLQARLTIADSEVHDNAGPGVVSQSGGGTTVMRSVIQRNEFSGLVAIDGELTVQESLIENNPVSQNFGGGIGIYGRSETGRASVSAILNTVGPHPLAAVWFEGDGDYIIRANDLYGGEGLVQGRERVHGNAVFAFGGVRARAEEQGFTLGENTFHGTTEVMVLFDASSARVGLNWWESETARADVWAQRCDPSNTVIVPEDVRMVACDGGTLLTRSDRLPSTLFQEPEVE